MYNIEYQRNRIVEWYKKEVIAASESLYLQVKVFATNRAIAIDQSTMKALEKWIYCIRKIKLRSEKLIGGDIRYYFDLVLSRNNELGI